MTRTNLARAALAAWCGVTPDKLPPEKAWIEHPDDLNRQAWDRVVSAILEDQGRQLADQAATIARQASEIERLRVEVMQLRPPPRPKAEEIIRHIKEHRTEFRSSIREAYHAVQSGWRSSALTTQGEG
ncbi:MAG: hypothetical protein J7521_20145 [Caulobacter sp.]|nr:hypothetical protein [Caulobacter sp.]